jgi:uncharacterized protein (TIGR02001 family)
LGTFFLFSPDISVAEFHGTLTTTSNYVYRGYSKSNNHFAYQANIDYEHTLGGYIGTSVSNVDFGDKDFENSARIEITPYLGWSFDLSNDWRLDLQWMRYLYAGKVFGKQADYNEFYLLLHYSDMLSANISFSEDYYNQGKSSGNYELTGRYPVTDYLQISGSAGYSQTKETLEYDYVYWNAGFTFFYKFAALDFRYIDAAEAEAQHSGHMVNKWPYDPKLIKPSFLFTISVGL